MKLLLDLGNTRLKWALVDVGVWQARGAVAWQDDVSAALAQAWHGLPLPPRVVGSSVVDGVREQMLEAAVKRAFSRPVQWVRTPAQAGGWRNAYAEPQRLGTDRFMSMLAAYSAGQGPCVLAGLGTALTLDALDADGRHLGGLIAPSPQLMQQALLGATVRVRPERPGEVLALADNTADAVASGCWQAAAALIERFHSKVSEQQLVHPRLLLDGGDAEQLLPLLGVAAELAPDSVLRGLLAWCDLNEVTPPVTGSL